MCDSFENEAFPCYLRVNLLVSCAYAKAHLPAEKEEARPHSRVPRTYRNPDRARRAPSPPPQGPSEAHRLMIPRTMRLSRAHFAPSGPEKRATSEHFSLSVRESQASGGCAAVISKKTAKLSVSRHLLKRRILSVLKPWCSKDKAIIVYARAGAPTLTYQELKAELEELIARTLK